MTVIYFIQRNLTWFFTSYCSFFILIIPDDDSFARVETCRMNLLESFSNVNSPSQPVKLFEDDPLHSCLLPSITLYYVERLYSRMRRSAIELKFTIIYAIDLTVYLHRAPHDLLGTVWNTSLSESRLEILESDAVFTYV
jgi:hypothetical protein